MASRYIAILIPRAGVIETAGEFDFESFPTIGEAMRKLGEFAQAFHGHAAREGLWVEEIAQTDRRPKSPEQAGTIPFYVLYLAEGRLVARGVVVELRDESALVPVVAADLKRFICGVPWEVEERDRGAGRRPKPLAIMAEPRPVIVSPGNGRI